MDLFDALAYSPMLIRDEVEPFNSSDWLYELKFDGSRCLAYLEGNRTILQNKRKALLAASFPELSTMGKAAKSRCVLDGELIVISPVDGKPDFEALQSREIMTNSFRIQIAAKQRPASFVAFDILYYDRQDLIYTPLEERLNILLSAISETDKLAISRHYENGVDLFRLTQENDLEGIVAKKKGSIYLPGKRTGDWVKIKNLVDEDFVAAGFIDKGDGVFSVVLGQYHGNELVYCGHVTLGATMSKVTRYPRGVCPFRGIPDGNESAQWYDPLQVVTVTYMRRTSSGSMRQNRLKGFRNDKMPSECKLTQERRA